jgi:plasmid maintenance system antidote protein VapI
MRKVNHSRMVGAMHMKRAVITQTMIAKYLKVSTTTVSRWVRGERPVPERHIVKLARALDKSATWLCGGHND